jgi:alpha-1,3-glucosyltransferase
VRTFFSRAGPQVATSSWIRRPAPSRLSLIALFGEALYLCLFPLLQLYMSVLHPILFPPPSSVVDALSCEASASLLDDSSAVVLCPAGNATIATVTRQASSSYEFLPLMMCSVYCAIGIVWSWLRLSFLYFTG